MAFIPSDTGHRRRALLDALAAELEQGGEASTVTVDQVLDAYLEDRAGRVVDHRRLVSAAKALRRHWSDQTVADLSPRLVRDYAVRRRTEGAGDGTIGRELSCLAAAARLAVREGRLAAAPPLERPERPAPRDRWLTRQEAEELLAAASAPHLRLFILLGLHTAARGGAIRGLTWARVDLDRRLIDYRVGARRSAKGRAVVPINRTLLPVLVEAQAVARSPWVLGRELASVRHGFAASCRRAGLEGITPHTLRHTAATWMVEAGVPIDEVARYLGHSSPRMVAEVYGHHRPEWLSRAAQVLEQPAS